MIKARTAMNLEVEISEMGVTDALRDVLANFYYYGTDIRRAGGLAAVLDREALHSHQLTAVLAALPRCMLALTIGILLGDQAHLQTARLVRIHFWRGSRKDGEQLCEPDFAVADSNCLILGEVKTSPKSRTARTPYSAAQLLNYLSLVEKLRSARPRNESPPTRFAHLIVLPAMDLSWFTYGNRWLSLPSVRGGHARIDVGPCYALASKARAQRYLKSPSALDEALARVPIICHTWASVSSAVEQAAKQLDDEESARFAQEIRRITAAATAGLSTP